MKNLVDTDEFVEPVRAPATNDFASEATFEAGLQDLANRTRNLLNRLALKIDATRQIVAGNGLLGGGQLNEDRTLTVRPHADGSIAVGAAGVQVGALATDAQHGNRGRGALHQNATSSEAGFMSAADKVAHDGLVTTMPMKADVSALSALSTTVSGKADTTYVDQLVQGLDPKGSVDAVATSNIALTGLQTVDGKALTAGMICLATAQSDATQNGPYTVAAGAWSRAPNANTSAKVTTGLYVWTSNGVNKGGWFLTTPDPITLGTTALTFERYEIGLSAAPPQSVGQANSAGNGSAAAPINHVHAHGAQPIGDGTNHAVATSAIAGFMAAADKTKLDGVAVSAAALGTANQAASGGVAPVGNTGAATTAARTDHSHAHGAQPIGDGTNHAVATQSIAGFQSAADKTKLDGVATGATNTPLATASQAASGGVADVGTTGSATNAARADHVHAHGAQTNPAHHALASAAAHGFQSSTDKARADLIYNWLTGTRNVTRKLEIYSARMSAPWTISVPTTGAGYMPAPTVQGDNSLTIPAPPTINTADAYGLLCELSAELPFDALYITGATVTLDNRNRSAPGTMPGVKMQFVLASYDKSGARTILATQIDPSANTTAYNTIHDVTWSGSIAINPSLRYVLEVYPETNTDAASGGRVQDIQLTVTVAEALDGIVYAMVPHTWLRADSVNLSGANTTQLRNRALGATDVFSIAGTLAAPSADSAICGQSSLTLTGGQHATSTRPASDFNFLHQQFDVFHVFVPTAISNYHVLHSTGFAAGNWSQTSWGVAGLVSSDVYGTSTGTHAAVIPTPITAGVPFASNGSFSNAAGLAATNNAGVGAGDFTAFTGGLATAAGTLRLWAQGNGAFPMQGRWAETIIFNRVLSALERQLVREYIQSRYGIAASVVPAAAKRILSRAPFSLALMDTATVSGGKTTEVHDLARHGHKYTQSTSAQQCSAPAPSSSMKGRPTLVCAGAQGYQSNLPASAWAFTADGTNFDGFTVALSTSTNGVQVLYGSTSTGNVKGISVFRDGTNSRLGGTIFNNGNTILAIPTTSPYPINTSVTARVSHGTSRSPQHAQKTSGSAEVTAAYTLGAAAGNPQQSMMLMMNAGGTLGFVGEFACFLCFNRILTTQEVVETFADLTELFEAAA
jgi:hypothetical protein